MSRLTDLQSFLRGLGKIGACSCQANVRDFNNIYQNTYIKPVVQQAVKIVLDIKEPHTVSGPKDSLRQRQKGLQFQQAAENLPLVLQGMRIFASVVMTGSPSVRGVAGPGSREHSRDLLVLNPEVTALDLLEFDLTNPSLLRDKIFTKPLDLAENVVAESPPNRPHHRPLYPTDQEPLGRVNNEAGPVSESHKSPSEPRIEASKLSSSAQSRRVPSSRVSRVASFASLGVGLGLGVVAEGARRAVGVSQSQGQ